MGYSLLFLEVDEGLKVVGIRLTGVVKYVLL